MASVMGICGGLVGPKSGNVEKVLVFKGFLKGFFEGDGERVFYIGGYLGRFEVEKVTFLI